MQSMSTQAHPMHFLPWQREQVLPRADNMMGHIENHLERLSTDDTVPCPHPQCKAAWWFSRSTQPQCIRSFCMCSFVSLLPSSCYFQSLFQRTFIICASQKLLALFFGGLFWSITLMGWCVFDWEDGRFRLLAEFNGFIKVSIYTVVGAAVAIAISASSQFISSGVSLFFCFDII